MQAGMGSVWLTTGVSTSRPADTLPCAASAWADELRCAHLARSHSDEAGPDREAGLSAQRTLLLSHPPGSPNTGRTASTAMQSNTVKRTSRPVLYERMIRAVLCLIIPVLMIAGLHALSSYDRMAKGL